MSRAVRGPLVRARAFQSRLSGDARLPKMRGMSEEKEESPWPREPAVLFGPKGNRRMNAVIDWAQSGWGGMYRYAEGYRVAATAVFDTVASGEQRADWMVWPLVHLWRHHLELALKWLIATATAPREGAPYPEHHDLVKLWREARPHLEKIAPSAYEYEIVEANIRELQDVDPRGTGFRYPFDRGSRKASLPEAPDEVNLPNFHRRMEAISNFLDAAHSAVMDTLDHDVP